MKFRLAENQDLDKGFNIYSKAIDEMNKIDINIKMLLLMLYIDYV